MDEKEHLNEVMETQNNDVMGGHSMENNGNIPFDN